MEQIAILAALALAVNKTTSVVKWALNKDVNAVVTQIAVWVFGFVAVLLAAHADVTREIIVPGTVAPLGDLDTWSLVLLGWILGSSGSFIFDLKKAIDGTDSAAEPSLLPTRQGTNVPPA